MTEQLAMIFERPRLNSPDVAQLERFLDVQGIDWCTRKEISAALGWNERAVRELAAASDQVISYPGSPGYKLLKHCTAEEYLDYRLARRSQARDMIAKVIRTDRIFYRRPSV